MPQPNSSRLQVLAPKVPQDTINSAAKESNPGQQPDFIETIRVGHTPTAVSKGTLKGV